MGLLADRHVLTVRRAAEQVRAELDAHDESAALRIVTQAFGDLDTLRTEEEVADFLGTAASTGDRRFDTLIAVLARWTCVRLGADAPSWTDVPPLDEEWLPGTSGTPIPEWREIVRSGTPQMFLDKNILAREKSWIVA